MLPAVVIGADAFLAAILQYRKSVTYKELMRLEKKIMGARPELIVSIFGDNVQCALNNYPLLFSDNGRCITRAENAMRYFGQPQYMQDEFFSTRELRTARKALDLFLKP